MSPRSNSRSVPHRPQNAGRTSTSPAAGTSDARSTSAISPGLSTTRARLTVLSLRHREDQTRHSALAPTGCQRRSVDTTKLVVQSVATRPRGSHFGTRTLRRGEPQGGSRARLARENRGSRASSSRRRAASPGSPAEPPTRSSEGVARVRCGSSSHRGVSERSRLPSSSRGSEPRQGSKRSASRSSTFRGSMRTRFRGQPKTSLAVRAATSRPTAIPLSRSMPATTWWRCG